jgi:hypothetical protein
MGAATTASSAYEPLNGRPVTRSPARKPVTPGPAATTSPATSPPITPGSPGAPPSPRTFRTAGSVTPMASVATSSSPGPAAGAGASSRRSTSGPPQA